MWVWMWVVPADLAEPHDPVEGPFLSQDGPDAVVGPRHRLRSRRLVPAEVRTWIHIVDAWGRLARGGAVGEDALVVGREQTSDGSYLGGMGSDQPGRVYDVIGSHMDSDYADSPV